MAKGVKHYFKNGKEYKGATHKDAMAKRKVLFMLWMVKESNE